jgi:hypothetical protein
MIGLHMWPDRIPRPTDQLAAVLMGKLAWDDAPEAIRSWARLEIHKAAKQILAAPDKGTRRNMLGKIPPHMRVMVETEAKRLWAGK